jgi:predicted Zn-ribbon and HTH transcriptional regulator
MGVARCEYRAVARVTLDGFRCERCEHVWVPRTKDTTDEPRVCPKCKSPYWNRPRQRPRPKAKKK